MLQEIPQKDDPKVLKLVGLINPKMKPINVSVEPEIYAEKDGCFPAVEEKVNRDGGTLVLGWQIWKTNIIMEAEFHAVWQSPGDPFIDVTPKENILPNGITIPITQILFLPDPQKQYSGVQVDNIRINITTNGLVDDLIEIAKAKFRVRNKGDRAHQYGSVELEGEESAIYQSLHYMGGIIYEMINQGSTENSDCYCGSGKKYQDCHRNDIVAVKQI